MKLVNSEQMRQIDNDTIKSAGIPSLELMENAGSGIARAIVSELIPLEEEQSFTVFCGKGNNGGDGFVIARYLFEAGYDVEIFFLGPVDKLSADAKENFLLVKELDIPNEELTSIDQLNDILETDFIIDAVFGTGFEGAPRGLSEELIEYINNQPQAVIAVDMPSGLNSSTGEHEGVCVNADYTYTLAQPKYGLFVTLGREMAGVVSVIPIGIPDETISKFDLYDELITDNLVSDIIPIRKADGHKGDFGKLLVLAGSTGLSGAAVLASKSALRSGCGVVKTACPKTVQPLIAAGCIAATTYPLPDVAKKGALALRGHGEIKKLINENDALVIGPGVGLHHETKELIIRLLLSLEKPAVVDADALTVLAGELQVLSDTKADLILTPHPGEFERLSGVKPSNKIHERIASARKFAIEHQTMLVLKGSPTVVADINGIVYVNSTGNNGMATGGSGDVLSGIIGSLLAQGMNSIDAAVAGVYLHGLAGDYAADELGVRSLIASDIIDFLPEAFESV